MESRCGECSGAARNAIETARAARGCGARSRCNLCILYRIFELIDTTAAVAEDGGVQTKLIRKQLDEIADVSLAAESSMIYLRVTRARLN